MKLSKKKALELCPDFTPVETERGMTCENKDGEICLHANHFLCELDTFRFYVEAKRTRGDAKAMSPSRVKMLSGCARKFAMTYKFFVTKELPETPQYFLTGDAFTIARAKIDVGKGWDGRLPQPRDKIEPVEAAKLRAVLRWYRENPYYEPGSVECEVPFQFPYGGGFYVGFADVLIPKGVISPKAPEVIDEWKYAKTPYTKIKYLTQAAVYLKGRPTAKAFRGLTFKKPALRPKKKEKMADFEDRVYQDLCNKGASNIDKVILARKDLDIDAVLRRMKGVHDMLPVIEEEDFPPSYGGQDCGFCDYRYYCEEMIGSTTKEIAAAIKTDILEIGKLKEPIDGSKKK